MPTPEERRIALGRCGSQALACTRCPELVRTRTQVVFGTGNPTADLMFVGEAPGREEDLEGTPLIGRSGRLLTELLEGIGLAWEDAYITTMLKCRPPDNRDPAPSELGRCQGYLYRQFELVRPRVICPLGNFATKLLRGDPAGITTVHGQVEIRTLGSRAVRLYPLFHPAAALYQRSSVELLRADVARLPALLALPEPAQPRSDGEAVEPPAAPEPVAPPPSGQLGLF